MGFLLKSLILVVLLTHLKRSMGIWGGLSGECEILALYEDIWVIPRPGNLIQFVNIN